MRNITGRGRRIRARGFTLIELLVVVLIIGILASIAIPQYFKVVEKSRVAEANSVVTSIKSAQERFLARGGTYTNDVGQLDVSYQGGVGSNIPLKFFQGLLTAGAGCAASGGPCWMLTLTRHTNNAGVAARYGAYALTVNVPDFPSVTSVNINVINDLLQ